MNDDDQQQPLDDAVRYDPDALDATPPQASPEPIAPAPAEDADAPYELKTWFGHQLYACRYCLWTTFDPVAADDHFSDGGNTRRIHLQDPAFVARFTGRPQQGV